MISEFRQGKKTSLIFKGVQLRLLLCAIGHVLRAGGLQRDVQVHPNIAHLREGQLEH